MGGNSQHSGGPDISRVGDVVFGADRQVSAWVAARIPGYEATDASRSLGVIKGRRLVAGVVYDRWNGAHVEASIAAEPASGWADRETLHHLFYYPFVTLGCQAISVSVPSSNLLSLNLASKLGFEPEALIRFAAHDASTLVILKMFRDNCKWISANGNFQTAKHAGPPGSARNSSSGSAIQPG